MYQYNFSSCGWFSNLLTWIFILFTCVHVIWLSLMGVVNYFVETLSDYLRHVEGMYSNEVEAGKALKYCPHL